MGKRPVNSGVDEADQKPGRARGLLSVIVPCFNEQDVVAEAHKRLSVVLGAAASGGYELIYVDDGSQDDTAAILRTLQSTDRRVRVITLSRNFGHQVAVTAGLEHAAGDAIALIDADLQDPPEVLVKMLEAWRAGTDVAYGVRTTRSGEGRFKRWTAAGFYRLINRLSDVAIPLDTGDFRLMDRSVVDAVLAMPERDRFIRGMVAWVGFRQKAIEYDRGPRFAGKTKYPLNRMLRFAADGVLSFSLVPLRLAIWMGFGAAALSMVGIVYAIVMRLTTDVWVPGWTLSFIGVLFIGGVQLIFMGVIGEYLGRVYGEVKRRPLYFARERIGFPEDNDQNQQERSDA